MVHPTAAALVLLLIHIGPESARGEFFYARSGSELNSHTIKHVRTPLLRGVRVWVVWFNQEEPAALSPPC
ncbi:uncharacterized protein PHALS_13907 [Plasmopara halstedii]|uniref:RxLR-like protein n=1 Tax=Plasmopara halstedii TaxID=4781 RepID=A0A0P1A3X5_PLAHL|nr:uncharacterized protein PHALS_13907 [Plasmopara halstedii]CEG35153.1 hypothetical protein PHALS_13907 [Plasmopara halstedii]|eukprot:XP_024571522.1 hypothetical protein PHALS_13907 [Plasmopara halstedii]